MSGNPYKFAQFWQELKRRNVLRSLAIYAGSAFIILEAATIIFPRWGFPDWTIDLVLYLLILGAFINVVVAWIFDITPGGVKKTKPIAEVRETDKTTDSNAWKVATYISFGVIVALIVFNVVPLGKQVQVGSIQSLVILPFENYTGDDQLDYNIGDYEKSFEYTKQHLPVTEEVIDSIDMIFKEQGHVAAYQELTAQLELYAKTNYISFWDMTLSYYKINQYNKALDWIEKGYELHDPNIPYIATGAAKLDQLHNHPRFIAILEKMNLPLPED